MVSDEVGFAALQRTNEMPDDGFIASEGGLLFDHFFRTIFAEIGHASGTGSKQHLNRPSLGNGNEGDG